MSIKSVDRQSEVQTCEVTKGKYQEAMGQKGSEVKSNYGVKCSQVCLTTTANLREQLAQELVRVICESFRSSTDTILCVGVCFVCNSSLCFAESFLLIICNYFLQKFSL